MALASLHSFAVVALGVDTFWLKWYVIQIHAQRIVAKVWAFKRTNIHVFIFWCRIKEWQVSHEHEVRSVCSCFFVIPRKKAGVVETTIFGAIPTTCCSLPQVAVCWRYSYVFLKSFCVFVTPFFQLFNVHDEGTPWVKTHQRSFCCQKEPQWPGLSGLRCWMLSIKCFTLLLYNILYCATWARILQLIESGHL